MDTYCIVRTEHLNHYGHLFGGAMLAWIDEYAWLTASLDFPGCKLVTMAMQDIVFRKPAHCGAILRFSVEPEKQRTTSITYRVAVFADEPGAVEEKEILTTSITFVRLDDLGRKLPLPKMESYRSLDSGLGPKPKVSEHL